MADGAARPEVVRRAAPALLVLALVVALVVVSALGWRWRTHPTSFAPSGTFRWGIGDFPVGVSHYATMVGGLDGTGRVHIEEVRPVLTTNSARADVRFFVCDVDQGGVGLVRRFSFEETCPDPVPADGAWFESSEAHEQELVMQITPRAGGRVVVSAVEITYTDGWRHGTQVTGGALRAPAKL